MDNVSYTSLRLGNVILAAFIVLRSAAIPCGSAVETALAVREVGIRRVLGEGVTAVTAWTHLRHGYLYAGSCDSVKRKSSRRQWIRSRLHRAWYRRAHRLGCIRQRTSRRTQSDRDGCLFPI